MPRSVAVLSCLPLDRDDWHHRALLAPCGDFVRFVAETRFNGSVADGWHFFRMEAEFIRRKLDAFAHRGTTVGFKATAADIRAAALEHEAVVVIAHWKSAAGARVDDPSPANRLEAWDAMLTADELADLFPRGFAGTALLIACNSDIPAESFRRRHPEAMCICSRDPVRAGLALAKLDAALILMKAEAIPMWRALQKAGEMIDAIN